MKKHTHFLKYFSVVLAALCLPSLANAMFPTFDAKAVTSSIETKINVIKQTQEIQNVKKMSEGINSSIGSATASISKFKSDTIEKVQAKAEKLQKEKARIEKKKAEYEKIKKEVDEKKKEYEEMKALAEDYQNQAKELKNDASSTIKDTSALAKDASAMTKDVSSLAKSGVGMATSAAGSSLGISDEISAVKSTVSSSPKSSVNVRSYINSEDKDYSDAGGYAEEEIEETVEEAVVSPSRASFAAPAIATAKTLAPTEITTRASAVQSVSQNVSSQASSKTQAAASSNARSVAVSSSQGVVANTSGSGVQSAAESQRAVYSAPKSQGQVQRQVQNSVAAPSVAVGGKAPTLISNENEIAPVVSGGSKASTVEAVATKNGGTSTISGKKAITKPKVTHKAYYSDKNMVSKRKSVMGEQTKSVHSGAVATRQSPSLVGSNEQSSSEDSSMSGAVSETQGATSSGNAENAAANAQTGQGFFTSEYSEETTEMSNGEGEGFVEENEETVQRFVPVQKPELKNNAKGRRVPFGSKIRPAELEKEMKALEAEEALEKDKEKVKGEKQTFKFSEEMVFAQLGADSIKVYDNYIDGKFALSSKFVRRCQKDAKELADVDVLTECVGGLVTCMNDPNEGASKACKDELNEILSDQVLNSLAVVLEKKNVASAFEEKVVEKTAKDAAASKDERSDFTVNATINEEMMKVINDNTDLLAIQGILKSMEGFREINVDDLDLEQTDGQ